jgi:Glycoside hydrolase 123 N-terminal domain/Glycoside hydrolase 123, catalytic domain
VKILATGKTLFPVLILSSCAAWSASGNLEVWTARSLDRVGMTQAPGDNKDVKLFAARGEAQSFQIVVRGGDGGLSVSNVNVSDLQGPDGALIPKTAFRLYREKYVHVDKTSPNWHGSNQPLGPGWYADALIPFTDPASGKPLSGAQLTAVPFDLKAGNNQPVWVDIEVPRTAKPGVYSGTYTVTSQHGDATGPISLTVWNFEMPASPALKSSFLFFQSGTREAQAELLRNRISPASTNPADQAALREYGLSVNNTGPFSGADVGRCHMSPAPSPDKFKALAAAQHPGLYLYDYSADEIGHCTSLYPTIKQWAASMHQAGIKNLISMNPTPALYDDGTGSGRSAVDIWVVLPVMYNNNKANIAQVMKKGDEVWSYNTLVQDAYSPKWLIDFDPVNFRIQPGFLNQSLNLTGLLYWRVDRFPSDPWNNVNNSGTFSSGNYPGEGMLVYPGKQVGVTGVVASMRLKWLRDGVQDYDYVQILKSLGHEDEALKISRSVAPDWTNWTRDHNAVESARQQLGETISRIMNARGQAAAPGSPAN